MSFSIKSPINNNYKNIEQKKRKNAKKIYNALINVKMLQIPNCLGFNNKTKTNIITSSYFNMNLKNNNKNVLKQKKSNKSNNNNIIKNDINKTNNDLKSNYYSLIIANNKNNNLSNNYSKVSINSFITNSINKSKKNINGRRKKIINEEDFSIINKRKNYSFKIKVKKIKEKLSLTHSRNSSLKVICHSNDNYQNRLKTIISTENLLNINNKSDLNLKSKNDNKKNNNNPNKNKKKIFCKNNSVKSIFFQKAHLRNELSYINKNNNNNIYLSYSEKEKNKQKIKDKTNNSSHLIKNISNVDLINNNKYDNIKDNFVYKMHKRNKSTSCNTKIFNNLLNNKKNKKANKKHDLRLSDNQNFSLINKKYLNRTNILTNLNIECINLNNKKVISPKVKFCTNIIQRNNNIDIFFHEKNYSSISQNINNLKNILSKNNNNNYNIHDNKDNNKKHVIKNIPIPKSNKNNNNKTNKENKNEKEKKNEKKRESKKYTNHSNDIKDIKVKKVSKNKKANTFIKSKSKSNKNKLKNKEKEENSAIINKNNYDRDDFFENERKIKNDIIKNKISIIDILKRDNNNKSIGKKIKPIKFDNNKNKIKKFKHYIYNKSKDKKNNTKTQTNYNDCDIKINIKTIKKNSKKEEIIKNNIENMLFAKNNLITISKDNIDPFDDLYSIIKKINFNSISLTDIGIFNDANKEYKNYFKLFNNSYNFRKRNTKNILISKEKKYTKNLTESTKMNSTSSKKAIYLNNKKYNNIREFTLDSNDYININK